MAWADTSGAQSTGRLRALPGMADDSTTVGDRFVVWHTLGRPDVRVYDAKTGRRNAFRYPPGCGGFRGGDGEQGLLVSCRRGSRLLNLQDGSGVKLPAVPSSATTPRWDAIGRAWLRSGDLYRNRQTGRVRELPSSSGDAHVEYDLDSPGLNIVRLCDPLHVDGTVDYAGQESGGFAVLRSPSKALVLGECETGKLKTLSADPSIATTRATGGWTTWLAATGSGCARVAYAWDILRSRSYRWHVPSIDGHHCATDIHQTKYAVVVSLRWGTRPAGDSQYTYVPRLLVAPRPGIG